MVTYVDVRYICTEGINDYNNIDVTIYWDVLIGLENIGVYRHVIQINKNKLVDSSCTGLNEVKDTIY